MSEKEFKSRVLPLINNHADWKVEPSSIGLDPPVLMEFREVYTVDFGTVNPHMNFIATDSAGKGTALFSIQKNPTGEFPKTSSFVSLGPTFKALMTDAEGYEEFYLHNVPLARGGTDPEPVFEEFLNNRLIKKDVKIYAVKDRSFVKEMTTLEQKFSRRLKGMKLAVLYIKPGQKKVREEIFENRPLPSSNFYKFMDQIAIKISLKDWTGYRGDFGKEGPDVENETYYTKFQNIDIMFHIAPFMNSEQHRRLVGNDIGVIIFFDNPNPLQYNFDIFGGMDIGMVPHVFGVVEPHPEKNKYRCAFFSRSTVPNHRPSTPPSSKYMKPKHLKTFLFTKMHNGYAMAQSVPPMNRLYTIPRKEAIIDLVLKYPKKTNTKTTEDNKNKLITIKLIQGKDLASKDSNGFSDPYCRIIVGDYEYKSQIQRKTLAPQWHETFQFSLSDDSTEEFHIICMDWDKVGSHDYMGEYRMLVSDLPLGKGPQWVTLLGTTTEEVSGQIQLQFDISTNLIEEKKTPKREKTRSRKKSVELKKRAVPFNYEEKSLNTSESLKIDPKTTHTEPSTTKHRDGLKSSKSTENIRTQKIQKNKDKDSGKQKKKDADGKTELSPPSSPRGLGFGAGVGVGVGVGIGVGVGVGAGAGGSQKSTATPNHHLSSPSINPNLLQALRKEDEGQKSAVILEELTVIPSTGWNHKVQPKRSPTSEGRAGILSKSESYAITSSHPGWAEITELIRKIVNFMGELEDDTKYSQKKVTTVKNWMESVNSLGAWVEADSSPLSDSKQISSIVDSSKSCIKEYLELMKAKKSGEEDIATEKAVLKNLQLLHDQIDNFLIKLH